MKGWAMGVGVAAAWVGLAACGSDVRVEGWPVGGASAAGGEGGRAGGGAAVGGSSQGGAAVGGSAQGGAAVGGSAQGGSGVGGSAVGGAAQGGSGVGGAGGAGGCTPGTTQPCYEGPVGTEGVGACQAGLETCQADGLTWGPCAGQVTPTAEDCATGDDEDCDTLEVPCAGTHLWSRGYDPGSPARAFVAADSAGNVVYAGSFRGSIDFGGGSFSSGTHTRTVVAKLDGNGTHLWSLVATGSGEQTTRGVAIDEQGNAVVAGVFTVSFGVGGIGPLTSGGPRTMFVAKLDATGAPLWVRAFGTSGTADLWDVDVDSSGNVAIIGFTNGGIDFGGGALAPHGADDVVVAKLDANGDHVFSRRYGDGLQQFGNALAFAPNGELVIGGYFYSELDLGGGVLTSAGSVDAFLAKLDVDGNHVFSQRYGDAGSQQILHLAVANDGKILAGGQFQDGLDFGGGTMTSAGFYDGFVALFDASGAHLMSRHFGDALGQFVEDVDFDAAGNLWIAGFFDGTVDLGGGPLTSAGDWDVLVAKLDPAGNHLHSDRFGSALNQRATDMAIDPAGAAFVAGIFHETIDFGGGPHAVMNPANFLAKRGP